MKVKIRSMLNGGGMPPFTYYQPIMVNSAQPLMMDAEASTVSSKSSSDNNTTKGITDKDLLSLLKDIDALPSDLNVLTQSLTRFYNLNEGDLDPATLASKYIQVINQAKNLTFTKKEYDSVYKNISDKEGLGEYATTQEGYLVARTSDGLKPITVSEYKKNSDKYLLLSNSDLLHYRAHEIPGDNTILQVVSNGTSMKEINTYIKSIIDKIGQNLKDISGYVSKPMQQIQEGIKVLEEMSLNGLDINDVGDINGLYKNKVITKESANQVKAALNYLSATMPKNMKTLLSAKAIESDTTAENLLISVITKGLDTSFTFDPTLLLDEEGKKLGTKGSGSGSNGTEEGLNTATLWIQGYGNPESFILNAGTSDALLVKSHQLPFVSPEGKPIGVNSTLNEISQSQFAGSLDFLNVTMGDVRIDTNAFQYVLNKDGQAHSIDIPIDLQEKNTSNQIKPDFDALKRKSKADAILKREGIDVLNQQLLIENHQRINEVYQENNLPILLNSDGSVNYTNYQRFCVFNAIALERAIKEDAWDDNPFGVKEIIDDGKIDAITSLIRSKNNLKEEDFEFDKNEWYDMNEHDSYYEGTVYIPVNANYFASQAGTGEKLKPAIAQERYEQQAIHDRSEYLKSIYNSPGLP